MMATRSLGRLRRYARLLGIFWRSTLSVELEYRVDFASNAVLSVFWMAWAVVGAGLFFQFSDSIAGWTFDELVVVIGLFFTVNGLRQALFEPNLERMTDYVRNGTLDFLLAKPVDTQFMVSFRYLGVYNLFDPLLGLALVGAGLARVGRWPRPADIGAFTVMFGVAVTLLYALTLVLMAAAIGLVSSDGLASFAFAAVEVARFPVQLYGQPIQTVLTVVPIAMLTTFPAQALLGRLDVWALPAGVATAIAAVTLGSWRFRHALRSYAGASG
jgi:ABC-2 type transport system permease protein